MEKERERKREREEEKSVAGSRVTGRRKDVGADSGEGQQSNHTRRKAQLL
jgi:hypothetical protein